MTEKKPEFSEVTAKTPVPKALPKAAAVKPVEELGGPKGLDPTRFGDWSVNGRCIDF